MYKKRKDKDYTLIIFEDYPFVIAQIFWISTFCQIDLAMKKKQTYFFIKGSRMEGTFDFDWQLRGKLLILIMLHKLTQYL